MSSDRLIARNTIMLYIRMIFSVCINLYASRVILGVLGVEDYGIYNIVGGVVAMLGFLNTSMSGCTSRFLTYHIGRGDKETLRKTFSTALQIHIAIAILVFVIGETIGIWFVNYVLDIPNTKIIAANYVFQFSIVSAIISFIQVPYSADIISHERMDVYAYIEILNVLLKLCVIFLISCISIDKLISYSMLLAVVSLSIFLVYRLFCKKHFDESCLTFQIDKGILIPMLRFTSWDLYGNASVVIQQQGVNVLINRFFGVVLNAATGVATQASSAVSMFVSSFTMALRPPIIKKYASGDIVGMQRLLSISIVLCIYLAEIVCIPMYLRIDSIMGFWLNTVPDFAVSFCKWLLLANSVMVVNSLFTAVIHATGKIKRLSIISGSLYLLTVPFTYCAFNFSYAPSTAYAIWFVIAILVLLTNIIIAKNQIPELSLLCLFRSVALPFIALILTIVFTILMNSIIPNNMIGVIILFLVNALSAILLLYCIWIGPKYGWNLLTFIRKNEI